MKKYSYTQEIEQYVIDAYQNGISIKEICTNSGLSQMTMLRLLQRNNIPRNRNVYELHCNNVTQRIFEETFRDQYTPFIPDIDKYKNCKLTECRCDYFDNIDNQDKAYILGLLYADGNVKQDGYTFTITLQERDVDILNKIKNILQYPHDLHFVNSSKSTWQNSYRLAIHSKRLCDALQYHGCVPHKSLILQFPLNFPSVYYKDFLRGYLDGDGHIKKDGKSVSFISTRSFCEYAKLFIENTLHINCCISKASCKNDITSTLFVNGQRQAIIFLNWLYQNANLFFERKYETYKNLLNNSLTA